MQHLAGGGAAPSRSRGQDTPAPARVVRVTTASASDVPPAEWDGSMVETALEYVRARIVSGELPPGSRIKERDLVDEIGVSRVPIREALRGLATEGFVTHSPRRGVVVATLEPADLTEIFEVRQALEVFAAGMAVDKATDDEVRELQDSVADAERASAAGDHDAADRANALFHDLLVRMAHNGLLMRMLDPLGNRIHWLLRQNDDNSALCAEHRAIADAIAARDTRLVRRLALAHVRTSQKLAFRRLFRSTPQ